MHLGAAQFLSAFRFVSDLIISYHSRINAFPPVSLRVDIFCIEFIIESRYDTRVVFEYDVQITLK